MLPRVSGSMALSSGRRRGGIFACSAGLVLLPFFVHGVASAQSTSGTVLGTIKDPHGKLVPGAVVKLLGRFGNASSGNVADPGTLKKSEAFSWNGGDRKRSSLQTAESAGPRDLQLTARITF
jgi:hypothetical protein